MWFCNFFFDFLFFDFFVDFVFFFIFFLHIAKVDFYGYMGFVDFVYGRARKNRSVLLWQSAKKSQRSAINSQNG